MQDYKISIMIDVINRIEDLMKVTETQSRKYLSSTGVAMRFMSMTVGAWQWDPRDAIAKPDRITVDPVVQSIKSTTLVKNRQTESNKSKWKLPQIGNNPMVKPRAVEKANSLGSAPLTSSKQSEMIKLSSSK